MDGPRTKTTAMRVPCFPSDARVADVAIRNVVVAEGRLLFHWLCND